MINKKIILKNFPRKSFPSYVFIMELMNKSYDSAGTKCDLDMGMLGKAYLEIRFEAPSSLNKTNIYYKEVGPSKGLDTEKNEI